MLLWHPTHCAQQATFHRIVVRPARLKQARMGTRSAACCSPLHRESGPTLWCEACMTSESTNDPTLQSAILMHGMYCTSVTLRNDRCPADICAIVAIC